MDIKVYVKVLATFDVEGTIQPIEITWVDGRTYTIDRILEVSQAAALKAGGQGIRYTIRIMGQESYLFFERSSLIGGNNLGRWFVERKI
jgi:hypothetical protein